MTTLQQIPESLQWNGESLKILDQTKLPTEIHYFDATTLLDVREAIVKLQVRGAPAIGLAAAYGLYLGVRELQTEQIDEFHQQARLLADELISARPTAVNLAWAVEKLISSSKEVVTVSEAKLIIMEEAIKLHVADEATCKEIGENALTLLHDGAAVLTHCNAGSIATSRYGTALAPLHLAKEKGWEISAYATETRPVFQGARLTSWELKQSGIPVTLLTDNMVGYLLQNKKVDAVIVGADRITANGDTANKIGTLQLAILANFYQIPFYVAAPLSTIDLSIESGNEIVIEQRDRTEVTHIGNVQIAPEGIDVLNPAFDVTPNELITAIITEKGIVSSDYKETFKSWEEE
ncbi:S-methyl-5-thioribose-1-phosphate isomerase [Gottfriedia acidiceleris]|uniref:S-methyl-5-thioribose-1-phosphate isomerase n=1 Tax=Bacillaceae TaxID=186817 RepID=UPI000BED82C1|nr:MULTISPECIES: S-methyl-5-thioribose-1-phosphate isomerase [unclassified Bacillus (in: firmicutes)]PEC47754.1 S-methyl-5-thioribose-1-phosphate isomerase [Bacillus sp. AFS096315]PFM82994.1 S-methyl-5-thioribose-1-phosphate isomerase [Bacillus sp. AFS077874]